MREGRVLRDPAFLLATWRDTVHTGGHTINRAGAKGADGGDHVHRHGHRHCTHQWNGVGHGSDHDHHLYEPDGHRNVQPAGYKDEEFSSCKGLMAVERYIVSGLNRVSCRELNDGGNSDESIRHNSGPYGLVGGERDGRCRGGGTGCE